MSSFSFLFFFFWSLYCHCFAFRERELWWERSLKLKCFKVCLLIFSKETQIACVFPFQVLCCAVPDKRLQWFEWTPKYQPKARKLAKNNSRLSFNGQCLFLSAMILLWLWSGILRTVVPASELVQMHTHMHAVGGKTLHLIWGIKHFGESSDLKDICSFLSPHPFFKRCIPNQALSLLCKQQTC